MIPARPGALHFVARQRITVIDGGLEGWRLRWLAADSPASALAALQQLDRLLDRRLELMKERDDFEKEDA